MDDPGWAWPSWKFGLKGDDLFTTLHDQYNTFSSTIQDPEAFHHDVYEISTDADTEADFHRRMADRKQQRLRELNESLESAAIEIIANPALIGTEQWQFALQLFRTKSLDSLVRYFSSYLPADYLDRHGYHSASSAGSSFAESIHSASTHPSSVGEGSGPSFFPDHDDDDEHKPFFHEPLTLDTTDISAINTHLPLSPRSMTMQSDTSSVASPIDVADDDAPYHLHRGFTPRSLSFSGSEADVFRHGTASLRDDDETSQSEGPDSLITSVSDLESHSSLDCMSRHEAAAVIVIDDDEEDFPPAQLPDDDLSLDLETPTPKSFTRTTSSYLSSKTTIAATYRIPSPHRTPSPRLHRSRRRDDASPACTMRRSPEESLSRVLKPIPDPVRIRPRGRRRAGLD